MNQEKKLQIIIVDDNPIFLEGISSYLSKFESYDIVAVFNSGTELIEAFDQYDPDLILLDIEMPWLNGIETAKRLSLRGTKARWIAITMYYDGIYIRKLIEAGFMGFVNKNNVSENLIRVMESVLKGEPSFPDSGRI
jgi:DNA-binding NarL/FixJ family response regulator